MPSCYRMKIFSASRVAGCRYSEAGVEHVTALASVRDYLLLPDGIRELERNRYGFFAGGDAGNREFARGAECEILL